MVQYWNLFLFDGIVTPMAHTLNYTWCIHYSHHASIPVFLRYCLQSPFSSPDIDLSTAEGESVHCIAVIEDIVAVRAKQQPYDIDDTTMTNRVAQA